MKVPRDLNLIGDWWIPEKPDERISGSLTFDQQHMKCVLSISGVFYESDDKGSKYEHEIILGEMSDGLPVTLNNCLVVQSCSNIYPSSTGSSSIEVQRILLGACFQNQEDLIFTKVFATFGGEGINEWIKGPHEPGIPEYRTRIKNRYDVNIIPKPKQKSSLRKLCFQIESLEDKHLNKYVEEVIKILRDFLNFIIPQDVDLKSIEGVTEHKKESKDDSPPNQEQEETVQIFYNSATSTMFKPDRTKYPFFYLNNFEKDSSQSQFEKHIKKWFEISIKQLTFIVR